MGVANRNIPGSTTRSSQVTTSRTDRLLSTEAIPFMRPIVVNFTAEKMRPYGQVDVYFNGVNVNQHITPVGGTKGGAVIANLAGNISGTFEVPANSFRTGEGVFVLSDDPNPATSSSIASAILRTGGTLETRQATVVDTITTTNTTFLPAPELGGGSDGGGAGGGGGDPLAQTFYVNTKTKSEGCFITKIRVYFQSKDPSEPIELELRNVETGYPGSKILARKVLPSASVVISTNSTLPTDFVFDRPVYVKNFEQYSFVLKTNSTNYNAWVAEIGQPRVDKNESVAKQPNAGVMFISSNDSAWTAVQTADVKFQVFVANFSLTPAEIVSVPTFPAHKTAFNAAVETTSGSAEVKIFAIQHGLTVGSNTAIRVVLPSGVPNVNGISVANINGVRNVTSVDAFGFTFTAATVATTTGLITLSEVEFEPNVTADSIYIAQDVTLPIGTNASTSFKGISGKSLHGTQTPYIVDSSWMPVEVNSVIPFKEPKLITSFSETAEKFSGQVHTQVKTTLSTSDKYVSPFIRTENSGIVAFTHFLNNPTAGNTPAADWVAETSSETGVVYNRYVMKPVQLLTPASSIKIQFAANCVSGNFIDVYYRTISSAESTSIENKDWTLFNPVKAFVNTPDENTLYDYEYDTTGLPEFKTVQVKIVMRGGKSATPPYVKDLRVLALAT